MKITSGWTIAVIALAALVEPATPRAQFDCAITKVVITNTPESNTSVRLKEQLIFWIDDGDKSLMFADGTRLRITRFDPSWISGYRDDIRYEFNRSDGALTFAGSTTKGAVTTTVVGSGNCKSAVVSTGKT
jgi:hypothetical protein